MSRLPHPLPRLALRATRHLAVALTCVATLNVPCVLAQTLPSGFALKSGSVTAPATSGHTMTIIQHSAGAIVEWNDFSIGNGGKVVFNQPGSTSVILNRVIGTSPSTIDGMLNANGRVFIVNPNGVLFGATARVSVGGLVASTLAITNAAFNSGVTSGSFVFGDGTVVQGNLENDGIITVPDFGSVALLGGRVENDGTITTPQGTIALAAGSKITLDVGGDGLTDVVINAGAFNANGVFADNNQTGTLTANGGQVLLQATGGSDPTLPFANVVNAGTIRAQSLQARNGKVVLTSSSPTDVDSASLSGGVIDATGTATTIRGGEVSVSGYNVGVLTAPAATGSSIDVSGMAGGGSINIKASNVAGISDLSTLEADATSNGNGGSISVDGAGGGARVFGSLSAKGGASGGNGGNIETSGAGIDLRGIKVDVSAANGTAGTWTVDPYNVTILHGAAAGTLPTNPFDPVTTSTIQDGDINDALNAGNNVTITTGNTGPTTDGSVNFDTGVVIDRNSGTTPLTFRIDASTNIANAAPLMIESTAGPLNVIFDTDANGIHPDNASINLDTATILTNGGNISMYGQNDPVAGYATSDLLGGIRLTGTTLDTRIGQNDANAGGDVLLRGQGDNYATGFTGYAVDLLATQINASTGNITIYGDGSIPNPGGAVGSGTRLDEVVGLPNPTTAVSTTSGNIQITGLGLDRIPTVPSVGLQLGAASVRSTTGTIDLRGRRQVIPTATGTDGLAVSATATVTSTGGPVWLTGSATGGGGLSIAAGSTVNAGTGNVVLRADNDDSNDALTLAGTVSGSIVDLRPGTVDANGNVAEAPADTISIDASASGFALTATEIGNITANTLVLGSDVQTGVITVKQALTHAGNLTLQGGGIAIGAALNVETHTLALIGSGAISQDAPITADSLLAQSSGASVQLGNAGNLVSASTLAGSANTGFTFANSNTVGIGTVGATGFVAATDAPSTLTASGVSAGGNVLIQALAGNMTLNGNVSGANVDLVSAGIFDNAGSNSITASGRWRVWGNTWTGETRGGLAGSGTQPNLYGCTYGAACTSGITIPATGNHFIYTQRPTLNVNLGSATREYGQPNSAITYTASGLILGDQQTNALAGTPSTTATTGSNVGSYPIAGGFSSPVGYIVNTVPGTLAITPATLTYAANAASRIYGDPNGSFAGNVTGFRNGDTLASATTGTLAFASPATQASNVGTYAINGSGLAAPNYVFVQAPANATALTITPATLTYAANAASRIYGDPNDPFTGNVTGFRNGDTLASATTGTLAFASPATQASNVGTYAINGSGLAASNYVFVQNAANATALTITPATLTLVANPLSRMTGTANGPLTGSVTGFRNGDSLTGATTGSLQFSTTAGINSPIGLYPIMGSGLTAANYIFVQAPANATALQILAPRQSFVSILTRNTPTSYVYGRNFGPVALCPATGLLQAGRLQSGDNLAREWSRLRSRPNLANCVTLKPENACSSF